ncbi:hypothetical protein HYDPIDRAFT_119179, partial [Hydnomerulius pinastri MD-312]
MVYSSDDGHIRGFFIGYIVHKFSTLSLGIPRQWTISTMLISLQPTAMRSTASGEGTVTKKRENPDARRSGLVAVLMDL